MGINGLLPLLKSIQKPCNLKKFAGLTLGVDAYGWLHRGTVGCAVELAMGKPTRKFVDFAMHRVRMLQHFGVTPFLIFDGDYLPSKAATEADRSKRRESSKALGLELLNAGKVSQANLELQKAVDVTPEMARMLIDELKRVGVQYIVAPYEADAQMVYLERKGIIAGILSEDSDLLVFGCKRLLTKLDQYGNCIEISKADFCACREVSLTGWSDAEFRRMAILSGCDYLASINNMGLKTAYRMVRKHKTIEKVIRMLQFDGKFHVPKGYLEAFHQAELTFLHQRVYCPVAKSLVYHTEPEQPLSEENMQYIGRFVDSAIATGVATGALHPMTKAPIVLGAHQNASTPRTPWATSRPQPRTALSSDLKKGVPIEQFFKPKRIPLAELDPNCFTPSPTQQDLLRRNSGPWIASPAPRPYLHRSATEPEPQLAQSESRPIAQLQRPHLRSTSVTEPRPPKRARLCADDSIRTPDVEGQKSELAHSRFFNSLAPEPSPSFGRATTKSRTKKEEIHIYSDDSIEEALLSLPDIDSFGSSSRQKEQQIAIYSEEEIKAEAKVLTDLNISKNESQSDNYAEISQATIPSLANTESFTSSTDSPATPDAAHSSVIQDIKEKFAFTPTTTTATKTSRINSIRPPAATADIPTPPSSLKPSRIPLAVKTTATKSARVLTPLQSLGAKALHRSSLLSTTPPYTPTASLSAVPKAPPVNSRGFLNGIPFPEVATLPPSAPKVRIEPADVPLPRADEAENQALAQDESENHASPLVFETNITGKGSEDLIIHDSEDDGDTFDENDILSSPVDNRSRTLHLGRFAFRA